jgi:hypothetical protein
MSKTLLRSTLLLAGVLAACSEVSPSKSVPTHEIYPRFDVETDGAGVGHITAQLAKHYDPFFLHAISLSGGDALIVEAPGQQARFDGPDSHFETTLQTGTAEDTPVRFDFQRPVRADAPNSIGYLPAPMAITLPAEGQEYTIGTDVLLLTWDSGGTLDDMWLEIDARCVPAEPARDVFLRFDIEADPGLYVVELGDDFDDAACTQYDATLKLARERDGAIDPAFAPDEEACGDDCDHQESYRLRQARSVAVRLRR